MTKDLPATIQQFADIVPSPEEFAKQTEVPELLPMALMYGLSPQVEKDLASPREYMVGDILNLGRDPVGIIANYRGNARFSWTGDESWLKDKAGDFTLEDLGCTYDEKNKVWRGSTYLQKSPTYQFIRSLVDSSVWPRKESVPKDSWIMHGFDVLVWLPEHKRFVIFGCYQKGSMGSTHTYKITSQQLLANLTSMTSGQDPKIVQFGHAMTDWKKAWHYATVSRIDENLDNYDQPSPEETTWAVQAFFGPLVNEASVETVTGDAPDR